MEQYSKLDFLGVGTATGLARPVDRSDATPKSYVDELFEAVEDLRQQLEELRSQMPDSNSILRVGPQYASDGSLLPFRASKEGAGIMRDMGGRYEEATIRNMIYTASIGVAGVAPGTALSTTPPLILYNPPNSGKILTLLESSLDYISGTLGAGEIVYGAPSAPQPAAPTGGTTLPVICNLIGGSDGAAVGIALSGSTLAAAPRMFKPAYTLGAGLATTPAFMAGVKDVINGSICILPSNFICLQGITATGSAPLVGFTLTWQETGV